MKEDLEELLRTSTFALTLASEPGGIALVASML